MLGLKRLRTAFRGGLWLARPGGLRLRLDRIEQQVTALQAIESRIADQAARRDDPRWEVLFAWLDSLSRNLGEPERRDAPRWDALFARLDAIAGRSDEPRWEALFARLDAPAGRGDEPRWEALFAWLEALSRNVGEPERRDGPRWEALFARLDALAGRGDDPRWEALFAWLEALSRNVGEPERRDAPRWETLFSWLDALTRRLEGSAEQIEGRLAQIGGVAQHGHDRALEASEKAARIDALLRSRSRIFGHEMFLDPTDAIVSPFLLRDGYFEPFETTLIESRVKPGDVVVDVGANIGYYTLILARLVGESGRVYAFEPDPANFQLLKKNVRANGYRNVVFVRKAVADASGPLSLHLCPDNKGDHRIYDSHDDRPTIPIEATTLDEYFADDPGRLDFVKMDIQGAEGRALRGMSGLLRRHPDVKMITEFWPAGLRRSGVEAEEYLADLERLGFRLFRIDEDEEATVPTTPREMLASYPADREQFSNLYCARGA